MTNTNTSIFEKKQKLQWEALGAWKNQNFAGVIVCATGFGKTRLGVIASCEFIKRDPNECSLIVVPTTVLKDGEWPVEINKWGYEACRDKVDIQCINTAYKYKDRYFDTLVVDEAHKCIGPEFELLIRNNQFRRIMCLTATLNAEQTQRYKDLGIKVCYTCDMKKCSEEGIVSPLEQIAVPVQLTIAERVQYTVETNTMNEIYNDYLSPLPGPGAVEKANFAIRSKIKGLSGKAAKYLHALRRRKEICHNAENKIIETINIISSLRGDDKVIVFCELVNTVINLYQSLSEAPVQVFMYHSKMGDKDKEKNLKEFRESEGGVMISAKALNQGLDIVDANVGIIVSRNSSKIDSVQRIGRIIRYKESKIAKIFHIYCTGTVDESWMQKSKIL
jgi:superfamily II DNA or RNA helicase